MKTYNLIISIGLVLGGVMYSNSLMGGSGDDHTHAEEKPTTATIHQQYFSTEISSDKYELLLRYEPIVPGAQAQLVLFVSDYITNKPVNDAEIKIIAQEDASVSFDIHQEGNGMYTITSMFPTQQTYSLAVSIDGPLGPDLLLLEHVDIGVELAEEHDHSHNSWFEGSNWFVVVLALIIGLGLGLLSEREILRKGKPTFPSS